MNIPSDSFDNSLHLSAESEVSNEESKKAVNRLHHIGSRRQLWEYPRIGQVREALSSLQPEQLSSVLEKAGNALYGNAGSVPLNHQDVPHLSTPADVSRSGNAGQREPIAAHEAQHKYSASVEMTALLCRVTQLAADSSLEKMASTLHAFNAMIRGATLSYTNFATDIESQGLDWTTKADMLAEARSQDAGLQLQIGKAQSTLDDAQHTLVDLLNQAETQDPISASLQKQLMEAEGRFVAAQSKFNSITQSHQRYVAAVLNPAIQSESLSKLVLNTTMGQAISLIASLTLQQQNIILIRHQESEEDANSLTFLIALMSKLINQNAGEDLKATSILKQKLSEAAAKDAEKKAQEYETQIRKAEEMQKTMGCVGKTLGWIITVVSIAAAVFTGGASLAFATVGLALMLGDEINQAINGHSFIQEAMQPIMESIIQPLMKLLADAFTEIVSIFGADKAAAEMAGQIMGALAVAILVIAGVMLVGVGISKVGGVLMEKITSNIASGSLRKIMDSAAGQVFKRITQGLSRSFNVDEVTAARASTYSQAAVTGAGMINTVIKSAGNIEAADMMVIAAKAQAKLMKNSAMQDLLDSLMNQATDAFSLRLRMVKKIIENIATVAENQVQAGRYILDKMSHVAG
ncbi:type III secretion system translocon subunit SctE [Erwinia tasmaniensis]|nr:type III secretion system translocon subunit SctE [Erwinia tasmaniensis]